MKPEQKKLRIQASNEIPAHDLCDARANACTMKPLMVGIGHNMGVQSFP